VYLAPLLGDPESAKATQRLRVFWWEGGLPALQAAGATHTGWRPARFAEYEAASARSMSASKGSPALRTATPVDAGTDPRILAIAPLSPSIGDGPTDPLGKHLRTARYGLRQ
jgi:hypothetical protein